MSLAQTDQLVQDTNPLDEKVKEPKKTIDQLYSNEDREYLNFIQKRLETAKNQKYQRWAEFGGMTYYEYYNQNERIANTILPAKVNDDDVMVASGTVEKKLDDILSRVNNLDLVPEVQAWDKENSEMITIGKAMEDTILQANELDNDDEKKRRRQRELLKQGTVFVQVEWLKKWEMKKQLKKAYNGEFKDFEGFTEKLVKSFEGMSSRVLYGPDVYLGNISEYQMEEQPYIYNVIHMDFDLAKTRYGKFENWKYVKPGSGNFKSADSQAQRTIYDKTFRLTELNKDQVEVIIYQDQTRDEYQVIVNGVLMLPIGFPLSAVSPEGKFNIAKQVHRVFNENFAYGGAFVSSGSIQSITKVIDEMLKLFVLKTRKSIAVPYANTSGRVISRRVLSPGRITMGINPQDLQPIGVEGQGVTSGEFNFLKEMQQQVENSTVSQQFSGQREGGALTATESVNLQKNAQATLGLIIASVSMLERKVSYLKLFVLLQNWFNPIDTRVVTMDTGRQVLKNIFRKTSRKAGIDGKGMGARMTVPVDGLPTEQEIKNLEDLEARKQGKPVRITFINRNALMNARIRWYIIIKPGEKQSSAVKQLQFRAQLTDAIAISQLGMPLNVEGLAEEFARTHGKSMDKIFKRRLPQIPGISDGGGAPGQGGVSNAMQQGLAMSGQNSGGGDAAGLAMADLAEGGI